MSGEELAEVTRLKMVQEPQRLRPKERLRKKVKKKAIAFSKRRKASLEEVLLWRRLYAFPVLYGRLQVSVAENAFSCQTSRSLACLEMMCKLLGSHIHGQVDVITNLQWKCFLSDSQRVRGLAACLRPHQGAAMHIKSTPRPSSYMLVANLQDTCFSLAL